MRDAFGFLGMHELDTEGVVLVRVFLPGAHAVTVIDSASGEVVAPLARIREEGLFAGAISGPWFAYRLRVVDGDGEREVEDPYRFPPVISGADAQLLAEGGLARSYAVLGAHVCTMEGVAGVTFAVWAPHAGRVAVIGDFNGWDGRRHGMRLRHECGVWEIFIPGVAAGPFYKFEIKTAAGSRLVDKTDPYAFQVEAGSGSAAIIYDLNAYAWGDAAWMRERARSAPRERAISIYEVHLGSWRRRPEEGERSLTYEEHVVELIGHVQYLGFTHIELIPADDAADEAARAHQPFALFAPTSRWGSPDQFRLFVDKCHQAGIGVIANVSVHRFSDEANGLREFDGTGLYEHPDPQQQRLPGAPGLVFDAGRREVAGYLIASASFWFEHYHLDAIHMPAVEQMLYLDYRRGGGQWMPNRFGGSENLEAVDLVRRINEAVYAGYPGAFTIAEVNADWQRVSHPTFVGGLGFGFRWQSEWIQHVLRYLGRSPVHRKYYHDDIIQGATSSFQENEVVPLSHESVSGGRLPLIAHIPGDRWQQFATLRTCFVLMFTRPGKKLMFMGGEFAQHRGWNPQVSLDWHLLQDGMHQGVQRLVHDLNALYRATPALFERDCEPDGFQWIDCNDSDQSIISFLRQGADGKGLIVVICNFTPVVRTNYRLGVPKGGFYRERLNSDSELYGGVNVGNEGGAEARAEAMHGRPFSMSLRIPPFASVVLEHEEGLPFG
ncbi:MAG: 1,4-alpha-glucan branching protein GlgB [Rhodospirillales bacterium]|nr:1,4-alpha-glucan branching protein GlgB [Rhodospirillales bacterium]